MSMSNDGSMINRTFIKDEAYNILSNWIITGKLQPKSRIKINELSESLGISRTPVREAILKLEDEGLIISKANRWTIVAPIDLMEAIDIYQIVFTLESLAIKEGFKNMSNEDITELEEINEKTKAALSEKNLIDALISDNDFHDKIVNLSANKEIMPILKNLKRKIQRIELFFFENLDNSLDSYCEHKAIVEAMKERDLDKTIEALKVNWSNTIKLLKDNAHILNEEK